MNRNLLTSAKIYFIIILLVSISSAINVYVPIAAFFPMIPQYVLTDSKVLTAMINFITILFIYGILGYIGIYLSWKQNFAGILDPAVTNKQRFILPIFTGIIIGIFFILTDSILSNFHPYGKSPHPPFPVSISASLIGSICEEIIFRLFLIPTLIWSISLIINYEKWHNILFWISIIISSLVFSYCHIPFVMSVFGFNAISDIPWAVMTEIILLNSTLSVFTAYSLKKSGLLAAIGVHLWTNVVWHVVGGI